MVRSLAQRPPSPEAISAATDALDATGRDCSHRAAALLQALFAPFPPLDAGDRATDLLMAWLLDAMLERPMWAIEAGCRALALSAKFRPLPAEIIDAIDAASFPLRVARAEAIAAKAERPTGPPAYDPPSDEAKARIRAMLDRIGKGQP